MCDSPVIVVETNLDRATVDAILEDLWREDRIECRAMDDGEGHAILTGIRRVIDGRGRRWGEWGRCLQR